MAATFTEITLDDFDKFLKRAFRALKPRQIVCSGHEYCYTLQLSPNVRIMIRTAITRGQTTTREVGTDTVKLQLVGGTSNRPLLAGKGSALTMKRTQGWKNTLQNRVEDLVEVYEERLDYWESRATGAPTPRVPEQDDRDTDLDESQDEPPPPSERPPEGPVYGTFSRLRNGDWGAKIEGRGFPGGRAILETKSGGKKPVTLGQQVWKGQDQYGKGYVEIWTIEDTRRLASVEPLPITGYNYDYSGVDD